MAISSVHRFNTLVFRSLEYLNTMWATGEKKNCGFQKHFLNESDRTNRKWCPCNREESTGLTGSNFLPNKSFVD